jgi:hypothetical protein
MVMFHHEIPYSVAYQRGRIQAAILERLTEQAGNLAEVDMQHAEAEVRAALEPLGVPAPPENARLHRRA